MNDLPSLARSVVASIADEERMEVLDGTNALEFLKAIYRSATVLHRGER